MSLCGIVVFYFVSGGESRIERFSMATAYAALALLAVTLCIGPLNKALRRPNPISTHTRRDLGWWSALLALVHTVAGLEVHLGGSFSRYFLPAPEAGAAVLAFVASNYAGAMALVILLGVLAISNDAALRRLGSRRWKSYQKWTYAAAILVVAHGALYQVLESRRILLVLFSAGVVAAATVFQLLGATVWHSRGIRRGEARRRSPGPASVDEVNS